MNISERVKDLSIGDIIAVTFFKPEFRFVSLAGAQTKGELTYHWTGTIIFAQKTGVRSDDGREEIEIHLKDEYGRIIITHKSNIIGTRVIARSSQQQSQDNG